MKDFIAYLKDAGDNFGAFNEAAKKSSSSLASLSYTIEKDKVKNDAEKLELLKKIKPAKSKMINLTSAKPVTQISAYHDYMQDLVVIDLVVGWQKWTASFTYEVFASGDIHSLIVEAFHEPVSKYPEARKALMYWFDNKMAPKPMHYAAKSSSVGRDKAIDKFPGIHEVVKNPVSGIEDTLEVIIIDLNDGEKWTRDQIADWLETLDLDLRFNVEETN